MQPIHQSGWCFLGQCVLLWWVVVWQHPSCQPSAWSPGKGFVRCPPSQTLIPGGTAAIYIHIIHTLVILFCTRSTLGLCLKRDSSICTITPWPPSITGPSLISLVEHTSLNHRYTSTAVFRAFLVGSSASRYAVEESQGDYYKSIILVIILVIMKKLVAYRILVQKAGNKGIVLSLACKEHKPYKYANYIGLFHFLLDPCFPAFYITIGFKSNIPPNFS